MLEPLIQLNDGEGPNTGTIAGASDATAANTAGTVVKRGASGEFAAGVITASFAGAIAAQVADMYHRITLYGIHAVAIAASPADDWNNVSFMTLTNVMAVDNTSGGNLNINSLAGAGGQLIFFFNDSGDVAETITLKHMGTGTQKFKCPGNADVVVPINGACLLHLFSNDGIWRVIKGF